MTSWTIVAVPEDQESVWKISSEKIPHMTLLFLGEQSDPAKALHITEYLQHAVNTSIHKFGAEVQKRGVLGSEQADVLFFNDNDRRLKQVRDFRSFLLADPVISEAYHSTEQFDGWTPHLTLGYPQRPARKAEGLHSLPLYSVYFDKIALWVDDFDGPTFTLEYPDEYAMAQDSLAHRNAERAAAHKEPESRRDILMRNAMARQKKREPSNLKHHGFGGKKFVHKNPLEEAVKRTIPVAARTSQQLSKEGRFIKGAVAGELMHGATTDAKKIYVRENQVAFHDHLQHMLGGRPSERANRLIDICARPDGDWLISSIDRVAHSATVEIHIRPKLDQYGMIENYELIHDQLGREDMRCALMHYGVKGMKWGVRRQNRKDEKAATKSAIKEARADAKASRKEAGVQSKVAKAVRKDAQKASGEKGVKSKVVKPKKTEEAKVAAESRKRSSKHGTDVLSNKELQDMVTRMNLEQQYQNLMDNKKSQSARSAGTKYVGGLLLDIGSTVVKGVATDYLKGKVEEAMSGGSSSSNSNNSPNRPSWIRNESNDLPSPPPRPLPWNRQRQLT